MTSMNGKYIFISSKVIVRKPDKSLLFCFNSHYCSFISLRQESIELQLVLLLDDYKNSWMYKITYKTPQGLLSTTFLVDVFFRTDHDQEEEEKKSIFVKIPLTGEAGKNFKQAT